MQNKVHGFKLRKVGLKWKFEKYEHEDVEPKPVNLSLDNHSNRNGLLMWAYYHFYSVHNFLSSTYEKWLRSRFAHRREVFDA
jgi:hypothetical protein